MTRPDYSKPGRGSRFKMGGLGVCGRVGRRHPGRVPERGSMAEERRNGSTEEQGREREHEVVEELRALDEMKNAFLSALSHELRTPVTAILGLARTIENDHGRLSPDEV